MHYLKNPLVSTIKSDGAIRTGPNRQKLRRDEIIDYFNHEGKIRFDEQFCMDFKYPDDFSEERLRDTCNNVKSP